jgi:hypothetical protein
VSADEFALSGTQSEEPADGPFKTFNVPSGRVCLPNINAKERRKRLTAGVIQMGIGLVILSALLALGADRWWRLILLPFFAGGASGFFQWRDHT